MNPENVWEASRGKLKWGKCAHICVCQIKDLPQHFVLSVVGEYRIFCFMNTY